MIPPRLSVMTLNLWKDERWQDREEAVKQCLQSLRPDILCLQELRASTRARLDTFLPDYSRVEDTTPGWTCEGNIYWRDKIFQEVEHGAEDIGILEQHRRLFWARLRVKGADDQTVLVSTAHFTYQENERERETGRSPRIEQANQAVGALADLSHDEDPILFMGDLNDSVHPHRILDETGYVDCFSELNLPVRPTFPARATQPNAKSVIERPLDWIFANDRARCIVATIPKFYYEDLAPSDHWPVLAIYELNGK